MTTFTKLNTNWNAEPNAPQVEVRMGASILVVSFLLNSFVFPEFGEHDRGELTFVDCWRYRLGPTNNEGWWKKQCRFSQCAPAWGEFYEVAGDLLLEWLPVDSWYCCGSPAVSNSRHFLFYFRDQTFECDAAAWDFKIVRAGGYGPHP